MGFFDGLKVPAVPAKPPVDQDLVDLVGAEPVKKTREGRLSASQWRAARELWFSCRSFTEVAERFSISTSSVSKRSAKEDWPSLLGQNVVANRAESRLEIEARVAQQLDRLDAKDKQALIEAVRTEHLRIGAELIEMARDALTKLGIDRTADAIALYRLGLTTQTEAIETSDEKAGQSLVEMMKARLARLQADPVKDAEFTTKPAAPVKGLDDDE